LTATDVDIDFLDGMAEVNRPDSRAYLADLPGGRGNTLLLAFVLLVIWHPFA